MKRLLLALLILIYGISSLHATQIHPESPQDSTSNPSKSTVEIAINEGVIFELSRKDAEIKMYDQNYAIKPKSRALKDFLDHQVSSLKFRSLSSGTSTTQFQNQDQQMVFYHSSTKGSNLYSKIAPKRFQLIKSEYLDESQMPQNIQEIYIIQGFEDSILHSKCQIVQTKAYIRDRPRSEMLINLNKTINPKLSTQSEIQTFLECDIKPSDDILS